MGKKIFIGTSGFILNVIIYGFIILFAIRMVVFTYDFSYDVFANRPVEVNSEEIIPVQIPEGSSTEEIADVLYDKGLVKYKYSFVLHVQLSDYKGLIRSGNYELSPSMTMDEMLEIMSGSEEVI